MEDILNKQFDQLQKAIDGIMDLKTKVPLYWKSKNMVYRAYFCYRGSPQRKRGRRPL